MPVPPEAVWDALADPRGYGYWVVGSKAIRGADADCPAPGSKFHHTIGFGPLTLNDHTEVLESERPRLLRLRAKGRPLGTATVELELEAADGGTHVRMTEHPDGPFIARSRSSRRARRDAGRNAESLMRLEELALRRSEGS